MTVGHTSAGQLKISADFPRPVMLDLSIFPGIPGYAFGELAFHSTLLDEPALDLYQFPVSPDSDFRFILLAKDPGVEVWNDTGSGFLPVGGSFYIGVAPFDTHPIWNITTGTPGQTYTMALKLHDLNGFYTDSDPLVLSFTAVPQPRTAAAGVLGLVALLLRRRLRCC